jgi:hypothetical protein
MAATIIGLTSLAFGGSNETVAVFTSFSQTTDSDQTVVVDENGDRLAVGFHNKKSVANLSGYVKSGTLPGIGATITLANSITSLGGVSGQFFVDSIAISKAPNDFNQITVQATNHGPLVSVQDQE